MCIRRLKNVTSPDTTTSETSTVYLDRETLVSMRGVVDSMRGMNFSSPLPKRYLNHLEEGDNNKYNVWITGE